MVQRTDRQGKRPQQHRASPLAVSLLRWAAQPVRKVNRRAVIPTAITMLLIIILSEHDPQQVSFVRNVAMIAVSVHALMHMAILGLLRRLSETGMVEAAMALHAYLFPRRITNLDMAMAWAGFAAAVSLFRALVPHVAAVTGG